MLASARALSGEQYMQKPHPDAWSVAQVINHVYLSEFLSLGYIRKKLSYPDQVPHYHPKSWLSTMLIKMVFALRIKVKAPATIDMSTRPGVMPLDELTEKWKGLRTETQAFIAANEGQFGRHLAFRHLYAGRLTMYQMLIFFRDHLRHHHKQVKRVIRKVRTIDRRPKTIR